MKTLYMFSVAALMLLMSCREEKEQPKVIYDTPKKNVAKEDTTDIEIADLPIQISGTEYLIHPIGAVRVNPGTKSYSSTGGSGISYTISNYNIFEITGFLSNLKFQHKNSDSLKVLTDRNVMIQTASYLKPLADVSKKQLIVYTLADSDTNRDGKLDGNDIKSLYISTLSGDNFTKLSPDLEELVDWKLLEDRQRLYFRSVEDTNKNGEFDKDDHMHYSHVDLSGETYQAVQYKPI